MKFSSPMFSGDTAELRSEPMLFSCIGLAVVSGWLAAGVEQDASYEAYFDPEDTAFTAYEQYREDFGSDEISYILYDAPGREHGVFDLEVMRTIGQLSPSR